MNHHIGKQDSVTFWTSGGTVEKKSLNRTPLPAAFIYLLHQDIGAPEEMFKNTNVYLKLFQKKKKYKWNINFIFSALFSQFIHCFTSDSIYIYHLPSAFFFPNSWPHQPPEETLDSIHGSLIFLRMKELNW